MKIFEYNINLWWAVVLIFTILVILIVFLAALRKGWLPSIASKWLNLTWIKNNDKAFAPTDEKLEQVDESYIQTESSGDLRDYEINYRNECLNDLARLGLSKNELVGLIQSEFRSHMNYFRFDLEDYMMPVKSSYIVYMDKIGNSITFKGVLLCTANEAKLTSWSDILAIYRRATRLAYRHNPNVLLMRGRGQFKTAAEIHLDIERRIVKHFQIHQGLIVDPGFSGLSEATSDDTNQSVPYQNNPLKIVDSIAFHLMEAHRARKEGYEISKDLGEGIQTPEKAIGAMVASLERSLQHLHKILILYPPSRQ